VTELRLEGVCYSYPEGERTLDELDLKIDAGESVALIGANGSGKTTLLHHFVGLLRPDRGRVLVGGVDAAGMRVAQLAAQVGLCFQHPDRQIFGRSIRDEVEFGAKRLGAPGDESFPRAKAALASVGLDDRLERHPADLGATERKLLTIASVLAMRTPVLAFDEPTSGLDARGIERIEAIVVELHEAGRTVIAVSHDMRFVAESFGRVILLDGGRVRLDGTPERVFAEDAWPVLGAAGLEPPLSARVGARLGLGSTPTEGSLVAACRAAAG
jgi:energy-coupling factor transport system ATP-binding protein